MTEREEQFLTDSKGQKIGVFLPIEVYQQMLEQLEELEDIKAYDDAKAKAEPTISLREAIRLRKGESA